MFEKEEPVITCEDIAITSVKSRMLGADKTAFGEFLNPPSLFGGRYFTAQELKNPLPRLIECLHSFMRLAEEQHRSKNCVEGSNDLQADKQHNITRLITNEFLFYTRAPLSLVEFQGLMREIAALASTMPENLHFILGSFAVLTENQCVMNVVPHLEAGSHPKLHLLVKTEPSSVDPVYQSPTSGMIVSICPNMDRREKWHKLPPPITVDSIGECAFSYHNVFECTTAGGAAFYVAVDICRDHALGVGRKALNSMIDTAYTEAGIKPKKAMPVGCLPVVVANGIDLIDAACLSTTTLVDPVHSFVGEGFRSAVQSSTQTLTAPPSFGANVNVTRLNPYMMDILSQPELGKIGYYNNFSGEQVRAAEIFKAQCLSNPNSAEVCRLLQEQGINPIRTPCGANTMLMNAVEARRTDLVMEMANIPFLDLSSIVPIWDTMQGKLIFPPGSLLRVTSMDLRGNPFVNMWMLNVIRMAAPNLKQIELDDSCTNLTSREIGIFKDKVSSPILDLRDMREWGHPLDNSEFIFPPNSLEQVEFIYIQSMSTRNFQLLLLAAPNLKGFMIVNPYNIDDAVLARAEVGLKGGTFDLRGQSNWIDARSSKACFLPKSLPAVTEIILAGNPLKCTDVLTLFAAAPKLEKIDLTNCPNLTSRDISAFHRLKPNLQIKSELLEPVVAEKQPESASGKAGATHQVGLFGSKTSAKAHPDEEAKPTLPTQKT